ncbi:hypothetical protein [Mastigocoleus testarum]|uniref:Uncharacterized protein n=1 Tax=Mastigocoleus testarum BC008 TaxID=371196 RepID=A0A0V7ZMX1_9CYAN|nr:hypothetical protein [Mastigocoleus testarum]KST65835.1 hypothetical protein BC008_22915 [Mastigocoleus testarum BC008]
MPNFYKHHSDFVKPLTVLGYSLSRVGLTFTSKNENVLKSVTIRGAVCKRVNICLDLLGGCWRLGIGDWGLGIALRAAASGIWGLGIRYWIGNYK